MRLIRILPALAIMAVAPVLMAAPAQAALSGPCTGTGTIDSVVYNPKIQESVVIPRAGEVHWRGTVTGSGQRNIEGKVYLKLPPPFGKIVVANGDWDGPSSRYGNNGIYTYNLPVVLVGPKFTVYGHHTERGRVVCTGTIEVQITGSKWKNPALIASLLLTVVAVLNFSVVLRAKGAPR